MTTPRLLVLGINFPPELTGIAPYTGAFAEGMAARGFTPSVLTAHPHYPQWTIQSGYGQWSRREQVGAVDVTRVLHYVPQPPRGLKRVLSEVSLGMRQALRRWHRPDVIVTVSPAMISSAIVLVRARILCRGVPLVVWVQDLYSQGMVETGNHGGLSVRVIGRVERALLRSADLVVTIHDRIAANISESFDVPAERLAVVRNWTHVEPPGAIDRGAVRVLHGWSDTDFVILHAGNMGVKQGLDNLVETARVAAERGSNVKVVLLGSGSERDRLFESGSGIPNLQFISPIASNEDFQATLASADALVVNELPGVAEMAVPSKLTSYFVAKRPVIAAVDPRGITAEEITTAGAGVVVGAGEPEAVVDAAEALRNDPASAGRMAQRAWNFFENRLTQAVALDRYADLLNGLAMSQRRTTGVVRAE